MNKVRSRFGHSLQRGPYRESANLMKNLSEWPMLSPNSSASLCPLPSLVTGTNFLGKSMALRKLAPCSSRGSSKSWQRDCPLTVPLQRGRRPSLKGIWSTQICICHTLSEFVLYSHHLLFCFYFKKQKFCVQSWAWPGRNQKPVFVSRGKLAGLSQVGVDSDRSWSKRKVWVDYLVQYSPFTVIITNDHMISGL